MKKGVLLVALLLFLTSVTAERLEYNYGDKVLLKGSYFFDEPGREEVNLVLVCGDNEINVGLLMLNSIYSDEILVEKEIIVPNKLEGNCEFILKGKKEVVLAEVIINSELVGDINLNDNSFQLVENLVLNGQITKKNEEKINGIASFYFIRDGEIVFTDYEDVKDGVLLYDRVLKGITNGEFILDVEVKDAFGNNLFLDDVLKFSVTDSLNLNVNLDKNEYYPGELIIVSGNVNGNVGNSLGDLNVILKFSDENVYENQITEESFDFTYKLIDSIKSGPHQFLIVVEDENGNYAERLLILEVIGISKELTLVLNADSIIAGSEFSYRIDLLDQAKDLLNKDILLNFVCKNYKKEVLVTTNKENVFKVPYYVEPGLCNLKVSDAALLSEKEINILEKKEINVSIDGEYLVFTNLGNVKYKENLNMVSDGVEKDIRVSVDVNDTKKVSLNQYLNVGQHDIKINDQFFTVQVDTKASWFSSITGNVVGSNGTEGLGFLIGFILVLILLIFIFKPKNKKSTEENHQYIHVQKAELLKDFNAKAYTKKEFNKPIIKNKQRYGIATDEDRKDFKERMIKQVRDQELRDKKFTSNSKDPPSGLFNM